MLEYPESAHSLGGVSPTSKKYYDYAVGLNNLVYHKKNDIILHEGTITKQAYVLLSGWAVGFVTNIEGVSQILTLYGPLRVTGLGPAIGEFPMPLTVRAHTDCKLAAVSRDELIKAMESDVELGLQMVKDMAYLTRSMTEAEKNFSSYNNPNDRLKNLFRVLILSDEIHIKNGWIRIPINLTHEIISEFIGVSRVTVSRILASCGKRGLIKKVNQRYYIKEDLLK